MKLFEWNPEKDKLLKAQRVVGFKDIEKAIIENKLVAVVLHPNQQKYPGQKIFIVNINNYAYSVPYIEENNYYFLKTIYPNRKATKKYLGKENNI